MDLPLQVVASLDTTKIGFFQLRGRDQLACQPSHFQTLARTLRLPPNTALPVGPRSAEASNTFATTAWN